MRTSLSKRIARVVLTVAVFTMAASCGDESEVDFSRSAVTPTPVPLTSDDVLRPGPLGVGVTTMTFVDSSRPTMANGTFPGSTSRTLVTEIWYPSSAGATPPDETRDVPLARSGGPYPLIIYSHGFMSSRTGGGFLARHLASHGYIVAACDFPLTNTTPLGGRPNVFDLANQPSDVHFLIDQLLALNGAADGLLARTIDAQRIGLTGLSLGGSTTLLATFHPTLRDPRIRAAAPLAGGGCNFGKDFYRDTKIPLMLIHGDLDAIVPYQENAVFAFGEANPPKYLVTLVGGSHTAFTDGAEVLFEHGNNPDDVGCAALRGTLPGDGEDGTAFLEALGGAAAGIIAGNCPTPCQGPARHPRSMRPSRQHQLSVLSVFPFFEAYLRGNSNARQFIEHGLAAENTDATVQFDR